MPDVLDYAHAIGISAGMVGAAFIFSAVITPMIDPAASTIPSQMEIGAVLFVGGIALLVARSHALPSDQGTPGED